MCFCPSNSLVGPLSMRAAVHYISAPQALESCDGILGAKRETQERREGVCAWVGGGGKRCVRRVVAVEPHYSSKEPSAAKEGDKSGRQSRHNSSHQRVGPRSGRQRTRAGIFSYPFVLLTLLACNSRAARTARWPISASTIRQAAFPTPAPRKLARP